MTGVGLGLGGRLWASGPGLGSSAGSGLLGPTLGPSRSPNRRPEPEPEALSRPPNPTPNHLSTSYNILACLLMPSPPASRHPSVK